MTGLSITVANIRSQIPGFVDILDSDGGVADVTLKGLEPHLEKMVSPDGMNYVIDGRPTKVHIGWNYDDANRINGLFASIYQDNPNGVSLRAFKMVARDEGCEKLFVTHSPYAKWAPTTSQPVLNLSRSSSKNAIRFAFISN
ncbi:MAG: hypothetical protein H7A42_00400 [Chlamydiales bacterium]|nr:hypothetical protein [Chlamydiales bacterium]